MYESYSGAFCALACLRTALNEMKRELRRGNISRYRDRANEAAYFSNQFLLRRESARNFRKTKPIKKNNISLNSRTTRRALVIVFLIVLIIIGFLPIFIRTCIGGM